MLWEFKNNKHETKTVENVCSVYGEGVITDRIVRNWFSKFRSDDISLRDDSRRGWSLDLNQDAVRGSMECNSCKSARELTLDLKTSQSTIFPHLKKIEKVSKLSI